MCIIAACGDKFLSCVGGALSQAPRFPQEGTSTRSSQQRFLTVARAPEPTDMEWTSLHADKHCSRALAWLLFGFLLVLSLGFQLTLTWLAERERSRRLAVARTQAEQV